MIFREIAIFIIGLLVIVSVNAIAFVFDAEWINVAIALDSAFIGSLSTYYFSGVYSKLKSNSQK